MAKENERGQEEKPSTFPKATGNGTPRLGFAPEALLHSAERSGLIFFRWDREGGLRYISDSVQEILGYTSKELIENAGLYIDLIHPEGLKEIEESVKRFMAEPPDRAVFLTHLRTRRGQDVWLSATIHAARDADGQVAAWDGVAVDATELVRARRAAVEGQQVFRTLFEEAPMALLMFDPHTLVIERANARACALYGEPRNDLEGSFVSELVAPDEWPRTLDRIKRSIVEAEPTGVHLSVHRKADGTVFAAQVAGTNIIIQGRVKRFAAVFEVHGGADAASPEASLAKALDVLPTPLAVLDASLTVIHVNPAFEHLVSVHKGDLVGLGLDRHLDGSGAAMLRERETDLARGARVEVRAAISRRGLPPLPVFLAIASVAAGGDRGQLLIATVRLPAGEGQAGAGGDAAMFFDLLAHDVTNYLTAVRGYLEIMEATGGLASTPLRMARVAREQSTNALSLISETRQLVEIGRASGAARAEGDLAAILDEAVERVAPLMQARPLKVRREYPGTKATVRNPDLLREVFVNLLHNAMKFDTHDEVIIDLTLQKLTAEGKASWRVRVGDRGFGLAEKDFPRVFDRGFRPSRTGARAADAMAPQGSGIGLSLCRFIVERAGGMITAESRIPGDTTQGSAFVVTLPSA